MSAGSRRQCGRGSRAVPGSQLFGGEPARSAGRWTGSERLRSPLPGTRHPLTDGPLADAQGLGNLVLGPALLLEVPGLQASGFFPVVGCRVHASQSITEPRDF
jgi:hypothetical protein